MYCTRTQTVDNKEYNNNNNNNKQLQQRKQISKN